MKRRLPHSEIKAAATYRAACRLAWERRERQAMTMRQLCEEAGLYPSHATDYFSETETRRELPARLIAEVERVLGNSAISQWIAHRCGLALAGEGDS